jgi:hypothetical protein
MIPVEGITFNNELTTATLTTDQPSSEDSWAPYGNNADIQDMPGRLTQGVLSQGRGALTWQDTVLRANGICDYPSTNVTLLTRHR